MKCSKIAHASSAKKSEKEELMSLTLIRLCSCNVCGNVIKSWRPLITVGKLIEARLDVAESLQLVAGDIRASPCKNKLLSQYPSLLGFSQDKSVIQCPICGYNTYPQGMHERIDCEQVPKVLTTQKNWDIRYKREDLLRRKGEKKWFVVCKLCEKRIYLYENDTAFVGRCPYCETGIYIFKFKKSLKRSLK